MIFTVSENNTTPAEQILTIKQSSYIHVDIDLYLFYTYFLDASKAFEKINHWALYFVFRFIYVCIIFCFSNIYFFYGVQYNIILV